MKWIVSFFLLACLQAQSQSSFPPIGQWKEHLPYHSAIDVTAGENKIWCATPYSVFTVDLSDQSIERLSRVTGLSETGVSAIKYDSATAKLVIAYANSNIDIIYRNDIFNIPDIKRENVSGDKSIYNIFPLNGNYYLSTGLGVIVIDGSRYEIKDSWFIGTNGSNTKVSGFTTDGSFFYAATDEGLKKIPVTGVNPANYNNWQTISGNGLSTGACRDAVMLNNRVLVLKNDSVFVANGAGWNLFYTTGKKITSINATGGKLAVCHLLTAPVSNVVILNADGSLMRVLQQNGVTPFPRKAIIYNNDFWIADQYNGLSHFSSSPATPAEVFVPNSPEGIASGEMQVAEAVLYAAAGEVDDNWNYQYNGNGIYRYRQGEWKNFNRVHYPALDTMLDFVTVAVDPRDQSLWGGSFGGGLLHIKTDESFEIFKQNSPLRAPLGDPTSYRVAGLAFDQDKNLWISNFGAQQPLVVRKADGNWKSFSQPYSLFENALAQIVIDDAGQLWIVSPLGNGLLCFDSRGTIDDINDDRWKLVRSGAGNGNLPDNDVQCIAKDHSGFIWVGTINGVGVIQCPGEIFTTGCEAVLPIVQQGNFAGYLFRGEKIQSIAVDGADRKWVASRNGAWLISQDGEKVLERFTEDNSPLLSNDVRKITIDGKTGEVYFATSKGICSFRGQSTEGGTTNSDVLVFPNPVPPGYTGSIGIRGLADNSIVKITELDGRLVFQTRALGGQAVWDGKDYRGRKISTGVYLVLVSTDNKNEKTVGKIIFVSK